MSFERFPTFRYTKGYDSSLIEGVQAPRPWDITVEVLTRIPSSGTLADIGCGPAKKLLPLSPHIKRIIGIDVNGDVLQRATKNVGAAGISNISLLLGDTNALPMEDTSVDMVTYMLAPHNPKEAYRVLKPGGTIIIERIGEQDKANIKAFFGVDKNGKPRGYRSELSPGAIAELHERELQEAGFSDIFYKNGFWDTWYSPEGLRALLRETPTVRDYDEVKDTPIVEEVIDKLTTSQGIKTKQHRVLIIGKKT